MTPGKAQHRFKRLLRETLLTVGAAAGVLCLLAAVASIGFDVRPLIFRSGSMSPTMATGALALARPAAANDLRAGDVISVINASGTRITHRVQSISHAAPSASLVLKGDANEIPDAEPYLVTRADRVFLSVNNLGYVISGISGPVGTFTGGVLVAVLLMFAFGRPNGLGVASGKGAAPGPPQTGLVIFLCVVVTLGVGSRPATDTTAAWVDAASAGSGSFQTLAKTGTPSISCGVRGSLSVQLSWTAVTGASNYLLTITPTGQSSQQVVIASGTTTYTITGSAGTGVAVVQAFRQYPSTRWYSALSRQAQYKLANASTCSVL